MAEGGTWGVAGGMSQMDFSQIFGSKEFIFDFSPFPDPFLILSWQTHQILLYWRLFESAQGLFRSDRNYIIMAFNSFCPPKSLILNLVPLKPIVETFFSFSTLYNWCYLTFTPPGSLYINELKC